MEFHAEIEQLRTEIESDDQRTKLLDSVAAFGAELEAFVRLSAE